MYQASFVDDSRTGAFYRVREVGRAAVAQDIVPSRRVPRSIGLFFSRVNHIGGR